MTAALVLLLFGIAADSGTTPLEFVDTFGPGKQTTPRFRAISLGKTPPRPLVDAPDSGPGTHFALARVGSGPANALSVVWQPDSPTGPTLWLDADNDNRLSDKERHLFTEKTIEIPATVRVDGSERRRTLVFRRGAESNLYLAVRGHMRGQMEIADKKLDIALLDGDADGCFDKAGSDLVWIDLDADNTFDALTEQFPLGTPIMIGERTILLHANPLGTKLTIAVRGNEKGLVRLTLPLLPAARLLELRACLVSEFGELSVIDTLGKPIELPIGKYRVDALSLVAADDKGRAWSYTFSGQRQFDFQIEKDKEIEADLLRGLRLSTGIEATTAVPGNHVTVVPSWQSASGTYVTDCKLNGASTGADITLTDAAGKILERTVSGFA